MSRGISVTYVLGVLRVLHITCRTYVTWPRAQPGRGAMWRSGAPQRRGARAAQRAAMHIRAVMRSFAHESRGTTFSPIHSLFNPFHYLGNHKQLTLGSWPNQYREQAHDEMRTSKRKVSEFDQRKCELVWARKSNERAAKSIS